MAPYFMVPYFNPPTVSLALRNCLMLRVSRKSSKYHSLWCSMTQLRIKPSLQALQLKLLAYDVGSVVFVNKGKLNLISPESNFLSFLSNQPNFTWKYKA